MAKARGTAETSRVTNCFSSSRLSRYSKRHFQAYLFTCALWNVVIYRLYTVHHYRRAPVTRGLVVITETSISFEQIYCLRSRSLLSARAAISATGSNIFVACRSSPWRVLLQCTFITQLKTLLQKGGSYTIC